MWIHGIQVGEFGALRNTRLTGLDPGLNILAGPNEAGKTTLLEAVRAALFGFTSRREKRNPYFGGEGGHRNVGLTLVLPPDQRWKLTRTEGKGGGTLVLTGPAGQTAGDAQLPEWLTHVDRDFYEAVFAFTLHELSQFDSLRHDQVQDRLLGASVGAGTGSPAAAINMLMENAGRQWLRRGRTHAFLSAANLHEDARGRLQALSRQPALYTDLVARLQNLEAQREQLLARDAALEHERVAISRQIELASQWAELSLALKKVAELSDATRFPPAGLERLERVQEAQRQAAARLESARARIVFVDQELASRQPDPRLDAFVDMADDLRAERSQQVNFPSALSSAESKARQLDQQARQALAACGPAWTVDNALKVPQDAATPALAQEIAGALINARRAVAEAAVRLDEPRREVAAIVERCRQLDAQLAATETLGRLPADAEQRLARHTATLAALSDQEQHERREAARLLDEANALPADAPAIELAVGIDRAAGLVEAAAGMPERRRDAAERLRSVRQLIRSRLSALGGLWSEECVRALRFSAAQLQETERWRLRLEDMERKHAAAAQACEHAAGQRNNAENTLAGIDSQIDLLARGPSGPGDGESRLQERDAEVERRKQEVRVRAARVPAASTGVPVVSRDELARQRDGLRRLEALSHRADQAGRTWERRTDEWRRRQEAHAAAMARLGARWRQEHVEALVAGEASVALTGWVQATAALRDRETRTREEGERAAQRLRRAEDALARRGSPENDIPAPRPAEVSALRQWLELEMRRADREDRARSARAEAEAAGGELSALPAEGVPAQGHTLAWLALGLLNLAVLAVAWWQWGIVPGILAAGLGAAATLVVALVLRAQSARTAAARRHVRQQAETRASRWRAEADALQADVEKMLAEQRALTPEMGQPAPAESFVRGRLRQLEAQQAAREMELRRRETRAAEEREAELAGAGVREVAQQQQVLAEEQVRQAADWRNWLTRLGIPVDLDAPSLAALVPQAQAVANAWREGELAREAVTAAESEEDAELDEARSCLTGHGRAVPTSPDVPAAVETWRRDVQNWETALAQEAARQEALARVQEAEQAHRDAEEARRMLLAEAGTDDPGEFLARVEGARALARLRDHRSDAAENVERCREAAAAALRASETAGAALQSACGAWREFRDGLGYSGDDDPAVAHAVLSDVLRIRELLAEADALEEEAGRLDAQWQQSKSEITVFLAPLLGEAGDGAQLMAAARGAVERIRAAGAAESQRRIKLGERAARLKAAESAAGQRQDEERQLDQFVRDTGFASLDDLRAAIPEAAQRRSLIEERERLADQHETWAARQAARTGEIEARHAELAAAELAFRELLARLFLPPGLPAESVQPLLHALSDFHKARAQAEEARQESEARQARFQAMVQRLAPLLRACRLVADGENTGGLDPRDVVDRIGQALTRLDQERDVRRTRAERLERRAEAQAEEAVGQDALTACQLELDALFQEAGVTEVNAFRVMAARALALASARDIADDQRRRLEVAMSASPAENRDMLPALDHAALQSRLGDVERELTALRAQLSDADQQIGARRREREQLERSDDLARARQDEARALAAMESAAEQWLEWRLAAALVDAARDRAEREGQPEVLRHASALFHDLTGGAFTGVISRFAEEGGKRELIAMRRGDRLEALEHLSRGTVEQLYLALRLALVKDHVARTGVGLPVVMDDIMVNFDDDRAAYAVAAVAGLAADTQVLLLTCHDRTLKLVSRAAPGACIHQLLPGQAESRVVTG